jgi:hypothetical protein
MKLLAFACMAAVMAAGQSVDLLQPRGVRTESATYRGKGAVHVTPKSDMPNPGEAIALVSGSVLADGIIEGDVAGSPSAGAGEGARGFIGIAFHVSENADKLEAFYLRPTNGRAPDQLRRNHSAQYISVPGWPWERTRAETPGLYESYVDLEPGVWTHVKIAVAGTKAQLYVNGAEQPCLIVNDLKLGAAKGAVALWVGPGTDGYFANLKVTPAK